MIVYVLDKNKEPLMPCRPAVARILLKCGKAKVVRRTPFTIKLNYVPGDRNVQELTLGIDTGSSHIGSSVVDTNGRVLYMSEIIIRNDITEKMDRRRAYRRTRRNRKTRYRKPRWLNRGNSTKTNRLSPTVKSKLDAHLREIRFVKKLLPVSNIIIEGGQFDTHALSDPTVKSNKWKYQRGPLYKQENLKFFIRARDHYICQICKGKSKDTRLEIHHVVYRSDNGSDHPDNLITLCSMCHKKLHTGKISPKLSGKKNVLKHATQMNVIRKQLLDKISADETFGYITKVNREMLGLPKTHYYDAVVIASGGAPVNIIQDNILRKKCVSSGDYQLYKGRRSEQPIPTGKICGFRKYDKVRYKGGVYFIKGRMSTGYAVLMDIDGQTQRFTNPKTPKMSNMERLGARKSWIMIEQKLPKLVA